MSQEKSGNTTNIFKDMKSLLLGSIGRLPASLVVILLMSMAVAVLTGVLLQFTKPIETQADFLPQRIESNVSLTPIEEKIIQGTWVYQHDKFAMTFSFIGDRFEWIVALGDIAEVQYYARGNYKISGDVLILATRPDLGVPYDPSKPWLKYIPLAMKNLNAKVKIGKDSLIWDVPSNEQKRILSLPAEIFTYVPEGHFVWKKS